MFNVYEKNVYAFINIIKILDTNFLYNLSKKTSSLNREIQTAFFHNVFKIAKITDEQAIILCKNIKGKCILIRLSVLQNDKPEEVLYLTNFINENEHD
jgi:hypothetical protein